METPKNRKQRRAAASSNLSIPLAHPPRDAPKDKANSKTLVDLIGERQTDLSNANPNPNYEFITVDPSALSESDKAQFKPIDSNPSVEIEPDQPLPPLIDTILLSLPLTTLHLTLAFLAAHQYAENVPLSALFWESGLWLTLLPLSWDKLSPSFLRKLLFPPTIKTSIFLLLALLLGAKLVAITNEDPYYAVMKRAPAIGTLWVWSILEVPLGAAVLGALGPLGWAVWWKGYGIV
ncbi:hypothetical protein PHISCL_06696 [Aspergillus sclerotialis]|uniref:DUF7719 domain-containing protein n=1 Tax=Aspergillus sclerotialis TaxID=2070753 RepID=A0A3A2ZEC9_9EURO|nr:hypothetical protein PHISCL_06696 [Aspergillus sclerotialis]